ncbi:MAG: MCE family protein, partial [Actinomycetes bacterium]
MDRTSKAFRTAVAVEHRVLGVAFLALLVFFGWLTYAVFSKQFTDYVEVGLESSKVGLQLPDNADVKVNGVIVGAVTQRQAVDDGARLTLGIYPDHVDTIPENVSARILPKTLFGEKYVALQVPELASSRSIAAGDVIEQSEVAIEVERVLEDIYPLLRAVQPADLNYTLTAMANALEGRGESIGNNLSVLDDYLKRTNPQIPDLVEDLRLLSQVSDTYRSAVPDLARLLRNSVTSGNTFVEKEQKIQALFSDVAGFSSTSKDFLEANGDNIIRLGELSVPQLRLYAKYAPEYPCLLQGQVNWLPQAGNNWRDNTLHINLETLPKQPTGYS